ncbi:hypothetical protein Tco_0097759 [Tanacetum coccineum]
MSKKQDCTALSTAEAKYVALSASCAQVMWMRTQFKDYGFEYNKIPLYCYSQSAIAISCNPLQHSRTKHINVRYHFIKEQVERGIIKVYFVRTEYQLADMFMKLYRKIVIMEYLVKISKKTRILELKRRHLKKLTLTSYTPYSHDKDSTKEPIIAFQEPERAFPIHLGSFFYGLSLDESRSPLDLFSDLEENSEEEVTEAMAETMEQYLSKT